MLCLLTLLFVALTEHLIQSTMRWENCIDIVDIDSIESIRDPCLVSTVSTCIVLMVWLKSPESQLSKTFCRLKKPLNIRKVIGRNVFCIDIVNIDSIECIRDPCLVLTVLTCIVLMVWLKSPESQLSKTFCRLKIH